MNQRLARLLSAALGLCLCSCASKPSLPRHASIERMERPTEQTNFDLVVHSADVIYFPSERAVFGARAEPAALLMEAVERSGFPFAIAWDLIDVSQQPLLDSLPTTEGAAREDLIARLDLVGSGRTREHCRSVLRHIRAPGVTHLALRLPPATIGRIALAGSLTAEEETLLPRGFSPPRGGLESYAERLRGRSPGDAALSASYRVEVLRQQFIAERIVRQLRAAGKGSKLVVFLSGSNLRPESGVPFYVAQKSRVRQLVLASDVQELEQPRLITVL